MAAKRRMKAALLVLITVVSAACSGSDGSSASADTSSGDTTTAAPETTEVSAEPVLNTGPSQGCKATPVGAGDEEVHLDVAGVDRYYLRHVPPSYDGTTPMPLVMDIHGYSEGAQLHSQISGFGALGDSEGFLTVSPHGADNPSHWLANIGSPDVTVLASMLDHIEASLCVDRARIYVVGFSNGAFMSSVLACELSDRIAAVAPVAGMRDVPGCEPERPVPAITFHGTVDDYVVYEGGFGTAAQNLPAPERAGETLGDIGAESDSNTAIMPGSIEQAIPDITTAWAQRNGCAVPGVETKPFDDITLVDFDCPDGADLQLYRVEDGGHSWPGSELSASLEAFMGRTTMSLSATQTIWDFFAEQSL